MRKQYMGLPYSWDHNQLFISCLMSCKYLIISKRHTCVLFCYVSPSTQTGYINWQMMCIMYKTANLPSFISLILVLSIEINSSTGSVLTVPFIMNAFLYIYYGFLQWPISTIPVYIKSYLTLAIMHHEDTLFLIDQFLSITINVVHFTKWKWIPANT